MPSISEVVEWVLFEIDIREDDLDDIRLNEIVALDIGSFVVASTIDPQ